MDATDRKTIARALSGEHKISMEYAFLVVDQKWSLQKAIYKTKQKLMRKLHSEYLRQVVEENKMDLEEALQLKGLCNEVIDKVLSAQWSLQEAKKLRGFPKELQEMALAGTSLEELKKLAKMPKDLRKKVIAQEISIENAEIEHLSRLEEKQQQRDQKCENLLKKIEQMVEQAGGEFELKDFYLENYKNREYYFLKVGIWPWGATFIEGSKQDVIDIVEEVLFEMKGFSIKCPFCQAKFTHHDILRMQQQEDDEMTCSCSAKIYVAVLRDSRGYTNIHDFLFEKYRHIYSEMEWNVIEEQKLHLDAIFSGVRYVGKIFGWKSYAVRNKVGRSQLVEKELSIAKTVEKIIDEIYQKQKPFLQQKFTMSVPTLKDGLGQRCASCKQCAFRFDIIRHENRFYSTTTVESMCGFPYKSSQLKQELCGFETSVKELYPEKIIDTDDIGQIIERPFCCPNFELHRRKEYEIVGHQDVEFPCVEDIAQQRQQQEKRKQILVSSLENKVAMYEISDPYESSEQKIDRRLHIVDLQKAFANTLFDYPRYRCLTASEIISSVKFPLTHGEKNYLCKFLETILQKMGDH